MDGSQGGGGEQGSLLIHSSAGSGGVVEEGSSGAGGCSGGGRICRVMKTFESDRKHSKWSEESKLRGLYFMFCKS